MVYQIKFLNKNHTSFKVLCKDALESIKFYKGRTYSTVPKNLDYHIKQWVNSVNCSINEKIYYKKINNEGTRSYYVEKIKENKLLLKVVIQSNRNKKSKKSGTFEVLTCEQEFCFILNNFLKSLKNSGCALEATSLYRKMSKKFDIGRDRLSYVLKWLNQNLGIDNNSNLNDTCADYCSEENINCDVSLNDESISDDIDNDDYETDQDENSIDNNNDNAHNNASTTTVSVSPTITSNKTIRKRSNSHLLIRSPSQQNKKLNRTLENLSIWNNEAHGYKIMSPLNRRERRRGQKNSV